MLEFLIDDAPLTAATPSYFVASAPFAGGIASAIGTGSFTTSGGHMTGGTLKGLYLTFNGIGQATISTQVSISSVFAMQQADDSGNAAAIETFMLGINWTYRGPNTADIAPLGARIGDNVPFDMRGNDIIRLNGGDDNFYSGRGNDLVDGGTGNDILKGGAGSDVLIGGRGIDSEYGGTGNDIFVFNAPLNPANIDVIRDFANVAGNNDAIRLENAVMPAVGAAGHLNATFFFAGAAAHDADDHIIYNRTIGHLSYDSNGNLSGGVTLLAVLTNTPLLTAGDFLVI